MNEENNEVTQEQTPDSDDFFAQLEDSVNGVVSEGSNQEETD